MLEVIILIPTFDNDGRPFRKGEFIEFEALACETFGGVTQLDSGLVGRWLDDGQVYQDTTLAYLVAVKSITDGGKVGELAEAAKRIFAQKAVYIRYLGRAEIL
jgi:hypothetical protein